MKFVPQMTQHAREYMLDLLALHQGNVSAVAEDAGVTREFCYTLLPRLGLKARDFRKPTFDPRKKPVCMHTVVGWLEHPQ